MVKIIVSVIAMAIIVLLLNRYNNIFADHGLGVILLVILSGAIMGVGLQLYVRRRKL